MPSIQYWLFKSEPQVFSIADLLAAPQRTTMWDGVRNYQARNFLRDRCRVGDGVLFYHSNAQPSAIVGIAEIVRSAYPDPTAFEPNHDHFDPDSDPAQPRWFAVDIRHVRTFPTPLSLDRLRTVPELAGMELLRRGSRLSIQPVQPAEWNCVIRLADPAIDRNATPDPQAVTMMYPSPPAGPKSPRASRSSRKQK